MRREIGVQIPDKTTNPNLTINVTKMIGYLCPDCKNRNKKGMCEECFLINISITPIHYTPKKGN